MIGGRQHDLFDIRLVDVVCKRDRIFVVAGVIDKPEQVYVGRRLSPCRIQSDVLVDRGVGVVGLRAIGVGVPALEHSAVDVRSGQFAYALAALEDRVVYFAAALSVKSHHHRVGDIFRIEHQISVPAALFVLFVFAEQIVDDAHGLGVKPLLRVVVVLFEIPSVKDAAVVKLVLDKIYISVIFTGRIYGKIVTDISYNDFLLLPAQIAVVLLFRELEGDCVDVFLIALADRSQIVRLVIAGHAIPFPDRFHSAGSGVHRLVGVAVKLRADRLALYAVDDRVLGVLGAVVGMDGQRRARIVLVHLAIDGVQRDLVDVCRVDREQHHLGVGDIGATRLLFAILREVPIREHHRMLDAVLVRSFQIAGRGHFGLSDRLAPLHRYRCFGERIDRQIFVVRKICKLKVHLHCVVVVLPLGIEVGVPVRRVGERRLLGQRSVRVPAGKVITFARRRGRLADFALFRLDHDLIDKRSAAVDVELHQDVAVPARIDGDVARDHVLAEHERMPVIGVSEPTGEIVTRLFGLDVRLDRGLALEHRLRRDRRAAVRVDLHRERALNVPARIDDVVLGHLCVKIVRQRAIGVAEPAVEDVAFARRVGGTLQHAVVGIDLARRDLYVLVAAVNAIDEFNGEHRLRPMRVKRDVLFRRGQIVRLSAARRSVPADELPIRPCRDGRGQRCSLIEVCAVCALPRLERAARSVERDLEDLEPLGVDRHVRGHRSLVKVEPARQLRVLIPAAERIARLGRSGRLVRELTFAHRLRRDRTAAVRVELHRVVDDVAGPLGIDRRVLIDLGAEIICARARLVTVPTGKSIAGLGRIGRARHFAPLVDLLRPRCRQTSVRVKSHLIGDRDPLGVDRDIPLYRL